MRIKIVDAKREKREFLDFPKRLYRYDPVWVCPLDDELESIFDPLSNHLLDTGDAARWILIDSSGETIGRIAAFIDIKRSEANSQPTGGIGFFEVIDNRDAAFLLFDTAAEWLSERGMEAMDGPINFGENDTNWGLLIEGFTHPGIGMPYNMKYYRKFFEEYGFKAYFEQYSYHRDVGSVEVFPERLMKIARWIAQRPGYSFSHFKFSERKKYISDLVEVYNNTWSTFKDDFTPLDTNMLERSMRKAKPFIDEELIWFAYHDNKPVGFYVIFPDLNQILRHFNGKIGLLGKLKFLYYLKRHEMTRMRALVAGIVPAYQNSGIESAIFYQLYKVFRKKRYYKELELSWVGDFNPKMIAIYDAIGAEKAKTHITYRYMINESLPFVRYADELSAANNHKKRDVEAV